MSDLPAIPENTPADEPQYSPASDLRWTRQALVLIAKIEQYTARGEADFFDTDDDRTFEAVQMRIINLGHAIASLSPAQRHRIGFAAIALHKMRSRIAHDYLRVDRRIIWKTATRDLPALANTLRTILAESAPTDTDRD